MVSEPKTPTGFRRRHSASCPRSGECRCSWEASVGSGRGPRVRRSFRTLKEARSWRADALKQLERGEFSSRVESPKLRDAAAVLFDGMRDGSVRTRSGHRYKPSVIRSYENALKAYVLDSLGALRLVEITRRDVQALADGLARDRKSASTVRNALMPLRVIYRRALRDGMAVVNPCVGIDLPARDESPREPPTREEAVALLASLPIAERPLWATALYAGLRLGELRALRWEDVDLDAGVIHVRWNMDATGELVAPKSRAGKRDVPIPLVLRGYLLERRMVNRSGFVFGRGEDAFRLWEVRRQPGLHACRHAYASFMIAAGVNLKTLTVFMGHSSVTVTADRYGHLFPGSEAEAAGLLDAYLAVGEAEEAGA